MSRSLSLFFARAELTYRTISKNWVISSASKLVFLLTFVSLCIIAYKWRHLPPAVPLWYSRPWGTEQLAHPLWLLLLPISGMFWFIVGFMIVVYQKSQYPIFTQVLFLTALLVNILSFVTLIKIIFLVT